MIYLASASQRGFPAPIGPVMYVKRSPPVHSWRKMFLRSPSTQCILKIQIDRRTGSSYLAQCHISH